MQRRMDLDRLPSPASAVAQWRPSHSPAPAGEPDLGEIRARTLDRGVNLPLYLLVRAILVPFFRIYLRLQGVGGEEVPRSGPLLLASNHRSFLDPFVIGALVRRPVYYVAKRELFARGCQAWLLRSLGAFPIDRGHSDQDAMATAKQILSRGDCVVIFPEGTRVRKGPLGAPRRGVGRLALETGAPVVPVAVIGTDQVRRGWRVRPRKVRVRFGRITRLPQMDEVSPSLAAAATGRVWACVALQWEWLGGQTPPRPQSRGRQRQASAVAPSSERQQAGVRCVE